MKKFNTYVINLKKDKKKWQLMKKNFKDTQLNLIRYDAYYGKYIDKELKKKLTNKFCNNFCTNSAVGCGVSHIKLNEYINNNDNNDFALICEDDIYPIVTNLKNKIIQLVENIPNDWDIIKLFHQGFCKEKNKYEYKKGLLSKIYPCGSTAAYLVSRKGSHKISNMKLGNHIDLQFRYNKNLKTYKSPIKFFNTDNSESSTAQKSFIDYFEKENKRLSLPITFFLNQRMLKIGHFNISILHFKMLILIIFMNKFGFKGAIYYYVACVIYYTIGYNLYA